MAEAPAVKPPPPPGTIPEGAEFLKNPGGVVYDVEPSHPGVALAKKGDSGWRFASSDEIREYCKLHNLDQPDLRSHAGDLKKAAAEGEQLKVDEAAVSNPSIEEPSEAPAKAAKK